MKKKTYTERVFEGKQEIMKEIKEIKEETIKQDKCLLDNENYREPLCVDTLIVKKIVLSTGGPEDGFKLYFSEEKELLYGKYFRADWGEYQDIDLTNEEAELIYDFYLGGYIE